MATALRVRAALVLLFAGATGSSAQSSGSFFDAERNVYVDSPVMRSTASRYWGMPKGSDTLCGPQFAARFWTIDADAMIRQWALQGNTVVGGDTILQTPDYHSLAFCAVNGQNTFYSSDGDSLMEYDAGPWAVHPTGTETGNVGGAGPWLYFLSNVNMKLHFYDGVTSNLIATAPFHFSCADVAVAADGSAYVLHGDTWDGTTSVRVYSSTGALLATYPLVFDSDNAYGSFMLGNTMYVGLGDQNNTSPDVLQPITFNGAVATLGVPIPFGSTGADFNDLANCTFFGSTEIVVGASTGNASLTPYPVPADDLLYIPLPAERGDVLEHLMLLDVSGRTVLAQRGTSSSIEVMDTGTLPNGLYHLRMFHASGWSHMATVVIHHGAR